jgi:hypothetical protein
MPCKFGSKDGVTFFQCSTHPLGGPNLDLLQQYQDKDLKKPYDDYECRHEKRFEHHGVLTCQDCGCVYNDQLLRWEPNREHES